MRLGVLDAGVVLGWISGRPRGLAKITTLLEACQRGKAALVLSTVNLAEVLRHSADLQTRTGVDVVTLLEAMRIRLHSPDAAVARRVSRLGTSLADGFAAATALELKARLHTTDGELVRQLAGTALQISRY
jgi:predicted nucleic acid-binding protein